MQAATHSADHRLSIALPDEYATTALGEALAEIAKAGDTILLKGEIGAGKTHLARALIQSRLGADTIVPSPSFTLVQIYGADPEIWHVDLYRVSDVSELVELGLEEALSRDLVLVEWPERADAWPKSSLVIDLQNHEEGRMAVLLWKSTAWTERLAGKFGASQHG